MLHYVILFSLLCVTALDAALHSDAASAAVTLRKARSIWPFSSSDASAESVISRENALLLEQAGLDKSFNLSSHPLWKIHKYHGIDLKPVQLETEIIKSKAQNEGEADFIQSPSATTSELPDLSFLDDLGGLADFLPDPEEDEASELIANAIEKEESSHPGFFKRLWWRIWGTPESASPISNSNNSAIKETTAPSTLEFLTSIFGFGGKEEEKGSDEEESLTVFLPETQGSYMAVVLPSEKRKNPLAPQQNLLLPSQAAPPLFREAVNNGAQALEPLPANHANQYRDVTGIEHIRLPLSKPVAQYPVPGAAGGDSQAWIQSWTPHAAYTVHVQGPSSQRQQQQQPPVESNYEVGHAEQPSSNLEPPAPVETNYNTAELSNSWPAVLSQDVPPVLEAFENTGDERGEQQASRKSSQDSVGENEENKAQEKNEDTSSPTATTNTNDEKKDKITVKDILSNFAIPEGLMKKLQISQKDVDTILNDKESAARAAARLRSLQKEFEMRQDQLSYVYATRAKKQLN